MMRVRLTKNKNAMRHLSEQNKAWFRPPAWYHEGDAEMEEGGAKRMTFTGEAAPPTSLWKLSFVVWMMVLNTAFQAVLAAMMWGTIVQSANLDDRNIHWSWMWRKCTCWSHDVVGRTEG